MNVTALLSLSFFVTIAACSTEVAPAPESARPTTAASSLTAGDNGKLTLATNDGACAEIYDLLMDHQEEINALCPEGLAAFDEARIDAGCGYGAVQSITYGCQSAEGHEPPPWRP